MVRIRYGVRNWVLYRLFLGLELRTRLELVLELGFRDMVMARVNVRCLGKDQVRNRIRANDTDSVRVRVSRIRVRLVTGSG